MIPRRGIFCELRNFFYSLTKDMHILAKFHRSGLYFGQFILLKTDVSNLSVNIIVIIPLLRLRTNLMHISLY